MAPRPSLHAPPPPHAHISAIACSSSRAPLRAQFHPLPLSSPLSMGFIFIFPSILFLTHSPCFIPGARNLNNPSLIYTDLSGDSAQSHRQAGIPWDPLQPLPAPTSSPYHSFPLPHTHQRGDEGDVEPDWLGGRGGLGCFCCPLRGELCGAHIQGVSRE